MVESGRPMLFATVRARARTSLSILKLMTVFITEVYTTVVPSSSAETLSLEGPEREADRGGKRRPGALENIRDERRSRHALERRTESDRYVEAVHGNIGETL